MDSEKLRKLQKKAADLVAQMDLFEKASLLRYNSPGVPRLGIPAYNWWNEGLHGVARTGTATVFPQAIGMAAMFDDVLLERIGDAVATETRAKFNENQRQGIVGRYKGLTMWSPNINIYRDPRWGRGQETYGEDPYLTARMGLAYIRGLQGNGDYLKTAACAKHFAVHSGPERGRHSFDSTVSQKDLYETYLPAFEVAVKEGNVAGVMGAYNRLNGEVCCGDRWLLDDLLRQKWGFKGYVVSDCGAIYDFHENHKVTKTVEESAAKAVTAGCDINCGDVYTHVVRAVEQGLLSEEAVTRSAVQALTTRMELGLLAPEKPYSDVPYTAIDCPEHQKLAYEASLKSAVLLKNDGILPLDASRYSSVAVIGPNADNPVAMHGNYNGTSPEYITLLDGIRRACGETVTVRYARGCHHYLTPEIDGYEEEQQSLPEAISTAACSDLVVLCLGMDATFEGEEGDANNPFGAGDRETLLLPEPQQRLVRAVAELNKPTVVLLCAGGSVDVSYECEQFNAVMDVFYPGGRGGKAVADLLFGKASPSGKLPVTFYRSAKDLPPFTDYSMKGRTYRYFTGTPLFPFGYGLSYSTAEISDVTAGTPSERNLPVTVTVTNTGKYAFEPLVQIYVKPCHSENAPPNPSLCGFARVALAPGESKTVTLTVKEKAFTTVNEAGERVADDDTFALFVGLNGPDPRSIALTGQQPTCLTVTL